MKEILLTEKEMVFLVLLYFHATVRMCSGSCNNETETSNIESEINNKSDNNSNYSEGPDADSEEEDW